MTLTMSAVLTAEIKENVTASICRKLSSFGAGLRQGLGVKMSNTMLWICLIVSLMGNCVLYYLLWRAVNETVRSGKVDV